MHNEKGHESNSKVDESNNNGLYPKTICSGQMGCFGAKNGAHHNSESILRFFL